MHGGVSQLAWQQHTGEPNNLVRMRSQSFGQSAPSLTAGLVSAHAHTPSVSSSVSIQHNQTKDLILLEMQVEMC